MFTIYITAPSDLHGPTDCHGIGTGRTLAIALQRARVRLDTYGPLSPGRFFFRRGDGPRQSLIFI